MNRKLLNMHIDNATPKKWTRKEKIISMLECLLILILTTTLIFLLSISDIIEGYLMSV
tara:strand:- start:2220 stop:2393 length:174 start_codon:yes stop_codon:yes gene_type:complete